MSLARWTLDGKRYDTAIIRDITERQNAEQTVREAAAFQRSVLDAMAEGMIIVAPDYRITAANARAAAMLGVDLVTLMTMSVGAGWAARRGDGTPYDVEDEPAMVTLRTGESCRDVEINVARPDGTRTWLRMNSEPLLDRDGSVIAAVATFSDITAERELAEQLRRSQRMEAVGQLAGGVAHDFNNLLAAIRGYSELALGDLGGGSPATADVEEVIRAADRGAALTRQLLQFSRRQVLAPSLVDPAEVVDGLIPMLRQLVGEHIELEASHDPRRSVVMADLGQLEQVILNLVVNARDAMPDGGRIEVVTGRAEPLDQQLATPPPAWPAVRITVADTGHGIDPAVLPHIFEPFYTTKEAGRGSGMGLATVYGIVGASGGTVSVTTSPGRGTTFTIDLPLAGDAIAPSQSMPGAANGSHGAGAVASRGSLLLVEDDAAVRAILARQLTGLGWKVDERSSGTSAASAVASGQLARPDLLVSDVRMPGLQGPDLARRLRDAWPDLPVLFVTGLADEVGPGAPEPGMHVLTKPFDVDRLERAIEAALESRS
jgi:PAS domain S-box-containing protein